MENITIENVNSYIKDTANKLLSSANIETYIKGFAGVRRFDFINQLMILGQQENVKEVHGEIAWKRLGCKVTDRYKVIKVLLPDERDIYVDKASGEAITKEKMSKDELFNAISIGIIEKAKKLCGYTIGTAYSELEVDNWNDDRVNGSNMHQQEIVGEIKRLCVTCHIHVEIDEVYKIWAINSLVKIISKIVHKDILMTKDKELIRAFSESIETKFIIRIALKLVGEYFGLWAKRLPLEIVDEYKEKAGEKIYVSMQSASDIANKVIDNITGNKGINETKLISDTEKAEGLAAFMYSSYVRDVLSK